jgi:predicted nucleic acid-binding protein
VDLVFLDANVLFSAAYRREAGLRRLWGSSDLRLLTSTYAVEEARRNLVSAQQRAELEKLLASVEVLAVVSGDLPIPPDIELPDKDRPILAAAIHARATHLLTGDFRDFGKYYGQVVQGVLIIPPAEYFRLRGGLRG